MNKKKYIKLEAHVITIQSSSLLAGSDITPDDITTEDQYSKENTDNGLWDE